MKQNKANLLKVVRDSNIKGAEVHAEKFRKMDLEQARKELGIENYKTSLPNRIRLWLFELKLKYFRRIR